MNRLIIIGNGFDLAHGLPTSYKNFIDNFWSKIEINFNTEDYKGLIEVNEYFTGFFRYADNKIIDFNSLKANLKGYCQEYKYRMNLESDTYYSVDHLSDKDILFKFRSDFFRQICKKSTLNNWVDIETEYYKNLIIIAKSSFSEEDKYEKVKDLNKEFGLIKKLLHKYLKEEVCDRYEFKIEESNEIIKYFADEMHNSELIDSYSSLFLSFNYTPTARTYSNYLKSILNKSDVNYIHGEIDNSDNSEIVFGYGDDKDENYRLLKNFSLGNDFLENVKPFEYNNNDNFQNLLDFLKSSKFTVYLIGHSCGLSDKYLLNQIFEHPNCNFIRVLFRIYEDGKDDFRNKNMNIQRHFDGDIIKMERIANKKSSRCIPQDFKFKEKL